MYISGTTVGRRGAWTSWTSGATTGATPWWSCARYTYMIIDVYIYICIEREGEIYYTVRYYTMLYYNIV